MNTAVRNESSAPPIDIMGIARRRKVWAIVTAMVVLGGFAAYSYLATELFRAKTLLAVEPGNRPEPVLMDYGARIRYQLNVVREVLYGDAVFRTVVKEFRLDASSPLANTGAPMERILEEIRSRVKIELDGDSAFFITYEGTDPKQSAEVANRLAELLTLRTSAQREKRNEQQTSVVAADVMRLRTRLLDLESQIERYKMNAVEELPERVDTNLRLVEDLQARIRDAANGLSIEEAERARILREITEIEKGDLLESPPVVIPRSANALKLESTQGDIDRLIARGYTRSHPEIQRLEKEMALLKPLVDAEKPPTQPRVTTPVHLRYAQLKADLERSERRIGTLQQQRASLTDQLPNYTRRVSVAPRHEQALGQLTREYSITKSQYEDQLAKQNELRQEAQVDKATESVAFRIVEPATPPLDPHSPNKLRIMLAGLVASLAGGIGMALLMERTDSTFKDVDDLQSPMGLRVLTIVPRIEDATKRGKGAAGLVTASGQQPRKGVVTLTSPKSVPAEQFHILAAQLRRSAPPDGCSVVMITSASSGEGKTLTSINLAMALSNSGARVLLIDADLRLPRVHDYLGLRIGEEQGLSRLIANENGSLSTCAVEVAGLTVLPEKAAARNPLALLSSSELPVLMERLRSHFQFIVVDSPPVLPIADAMMLGAICDQILLVVRARHTTPAMLRRAMECLDSSKFGGVVMNDVNLSHLNYSYVYRDYQNTYLRGA